MEPFTSFAREFRPIAQLFQRWQTPASEKLQSMTQSSDVRKFIAEDLASLKADVVNSIPRLGGSRPARVDQPEWKAAADGTHHRVSRHYIAVEIIGEPYLFCFWPDLNNSLSPVDEVVGPSTGLTVEVTKRVWEIAQYDEPDRKKIWGLYTSVYLTSCEELQIQEGTLDINGIFAHRRAEVEPIIQQLLAEAQDFAMELFPAQLNDATEAKLRELEARESVTQRLVFPETWKLPSLEVEEPAAVAADDLPPDPKFFGVAPHHTPWLAAKSFQDLLRVIRLWADAIERYPRSFSQLSEDQLSDLLAATLNATMPGANREVYTRTGKSDIFIQADVLNKGLGSDKVFIAESKWATSKAVVQRALDPQLFSYLTVQDTAAVLLLLFRQKDPQKVVPVYLEALRQVDGFVEESESSVAYWPLYTYHVEGKTVNVCIATVCIPPVSKTKESGRPDA